MIPHDTLSPSFIWLTKDVRIEEPVRPFISYKLLTFVSLSTSTPWWTHLAGSSSTSGGRCFTSSGPSSNSRCVFPFIHGGVRYNGCTLASADDGRPWCSTRVDNRGNHINGGGNWGHCPFGCVNDFRGQSVINNNNDLLDRISVRFGGGRRPPQQSSNNQGPFRGIHHHIAKAQHRSLWKLSLFRVCVFSTHSGNSSDWLFIINGCFSLFFFACVCVFFPLYLMYLYITADPG